MRRTGWWLAGALACWAPGAADAQSVNMGGTFHDLEGKAERVIVRFGDADVETRRGPDGSWRATLRDPTGRPQAELDGQRGHRAVQFRVVGNPAGGASFELAEGTEVGLDWAALQTYTSWRDAAEAGRTGRVPDPAAAIWDGHIRRDGGPQARGRSAAQLAAAILEVRTTFPEFEVAATLDQHRKTPAAGKRVDYSKFTARVRDRKTGRDLGFIRWFDTAQVVTWKIEGGGSGVILPERLKGGWTFTPDMAWANVQAYYFATRPAAASDSGGPVARRLGELFAAPAAAPALGQIAWLGPVTGLSGALPWRGVLPAWGSTSPAFNEPGCDGLHWLDQSIFRMCCDVHDTCYEKTGCSSSSWRWPFSGSWDCARCNVQAVYCFCTFANPYHCGGSGGGGGGGGETGGCTRSAGGFCPLECQSCIAS